MYKKLSIRILNLSIQSPHSDLIKKDLNGLCNNFLQPIPDYKTRILILRIEVINNNASFHIPLINDIHNVLNLPQKNLKGHQLRLQISKGKVPLHKKDLLNPQDQTNILIHGHLNPSIHGLPIQALRLIPRLFHVDQGQYPVIVEATLADLVD